MKAAKLIEEVRAMAAGRADLTDSATPVRLEVGEASHWLISDAAGWRSVHHNRLLPGLFGLPIVPTSELQYRFQVFNGAGAVILEGMLDP